MRRRDHGCRRHRPRHPDPARRRIDPGARHRRHRRGRAIDLKTIVHAYHEGPYFDELYAKHQDLIDLHDFDPRLAGAHRIGREASSLIAPESQGLITTLLDSPESFSLLAAGMGGLVQENRSLLSAYRQGFAQH
jgi:predicted nucleotidyltransferase